MSQAHEPSIDSLATDAELADELTRRVRQLARKGPRHALIAAFSSASEMLTLAMVRVQAQFLRDLGTFDRAKIGVSDAGRLGLPPDAMEAVSIVSSLSSQLTDLASAYGKFVHVTNIGKKSDEPVFNHGTGTPRPVGPDRNGHAGRENGTGEARQRRF
ncbi:MAG TPA: hypothetical protein VJZ71_20470 [Phycisphaerae bacterium]|nr:hypothetical protein [Phycisphaerae bacterium]